MRENLNHSFAFENWAAAMRHVFATWPIVVMATRGPPNSRKIVVGCSRGMDVLTSPPANDNARRK